MTLKVTVAKCELCRAKLYRLASPVSTNYTLFTIIRKLPPASPVRPLCTPAPAQRPVLTRQGQACPVSCVISDGKLIQQQLLKKSDLTYLLDISTDYVALHCPQKCWIERTRYVLLSSS